MPVRIVSIDFDNTLTRRVSAIEHFSKKMNHFDRIKRIEQLFFSERIGTREFSDMTAMLFFGVTQQLIDEYMSDVPLIDGTSRFFQQLSAHNIHCAINSVAFQPLIIAMAARWNLNLISGVRLSSVEGRFTGSVENYFDEHEKITFIRDHASRLGIGLGDVVAIGDSRSDVPLFNAVGLSIALNGDHRAVAAATISVKTDDLCDLLPLLLGRA